MIELIHVLVTFFATTIGAIIGIGGGVIIKPFLTILAINDISSITMLSTFTVLAMSFISTSKYLQSKVRFEGKITRNIVLGSILGGMLGGQLFKLITEGFDKSIIQIIQSMIFVLMLSFVLYYVRNKKKFKRYKIDNGWFCFFLGLVLGANAAFLGVGGGPLNVAMFTIFFSFDMKKAAVHSLVIKMFSQLSKIIMIASTTGFQSYDLDMLLYMIPAAIAGGFIGASLARKVSEKATTNLFVVVVSTTVVVNIITVILIFV